MPQEDCQHKNPLTLKGTAQENRSPKYLDPALVKIDDKTKADYVRILQGLAELITYYNGSHRREGQWAEFFTDEQLAKSGPHSALFYAFLELISYAQEDINKITGKHLAFYYKEVLQIAEKAETEDEAHILFELANNIDAHIVEEGTYLKAGKDADGNPRYFRTENEIVVNKAAITELKSTYIDSDEDGNSIVYASGVANSSDGEGEDLNEENPKWPPFGVEQNAESELKMPMAELGFAVANNFLLLPDGERILTLTLNFDANFSLTNEDINSQGINISFSGEEDWIVAAAESIQVGEISGGEDNQLILTITIPAEEKAIVEYVEEIYEEHFFVNVPVMKLVIDQEVNPALYAQLTGVNINNIELSVSVTGAKDVILQNETGTLDASKPFEPFGFTPVLGSEFLIGSNAIFSKPLTSLSLDFDWMDKPDSFSNYYNAYSSGSINPSFEVKFKGLRNKSWADNRLHGTYRVDLFEEPIALSGSNFTGVFDKLIEIDAVEEFTNDVTDGFIRMELLRPNGSLIAFGHSQYQNLFVQATIDLALENTATLPNEPWTPKAKSLSIDYEAAYTINMDEAPSEHGVTSSLFHIGPFGIKEQNPHASGNATILPKFEHKGSFFIGLKDLEAPQNLNLLFQIAEGSADPYKDPETIEWSYLTGEKWTKFKDVEILKDSTNGLVTSGIMSLSLPKEISDDNYWLTNEVFWIRGAIAENTDSVCQLINVHTQSITAKFENNDNNLSHLEESLAAETIGKLRETDSSIRSVSQPYASFGGKLPEEEGNYYRRVSERLRHKNRAITMWDFERIVLEEYPSIYKVKCLNHTRMTLPYSEQVPGHVTLIVISNLRNQNQVNALEPTTSVGTLESIKDFLKDKQNPFATVHVENPNFEKIKVDFNVKFYDWVDKGAYKAKLVEDIKRHLSPWAYEDGADISFDGVIHKSVIIDFIEELEYVDYLTCFKMYHIANGEGEGVDVDSATPTRSSALLVSADTHKIDIDKLINDDCSCEGEDQKTVITDGIGTMTVGLDFIVNKP